MLLALDTCGATGGVALGRIASDVPLAGEASKPGKPSAPRVDLFFRELAGRTYSELLLATISDLLIEAHAGLNQLSAIVVVHGPGSFTGIRIGVSAAKGLAEALAIPVIALSRLELLARKTPAGDAVAVLDAGRSEFYTGIYRAGMLEAELMLTREELLPTIATSGSPLIVCENRVFEALEQNVPRLVAAPTAAEALAAGIERYQAGQFDELATLDANYLRRSDAEILARLAAHAAARAALPAHPAGSE